MLAIPARNLLSYVKDRTALGFLMLKHGLTRPISTLTLAVAAIVLGCAGSQTARVNDPGALGAIAGASEDGQEHRVPVVQSSADGTQAPMVFADSRIARCVEFGLVPRGVDCVETGDCVCANLAGMDFSNRDLSGVDFSQADLREVNFRGAMLARAELTGAAIHGADFRRANLLGAVLSSASCHIEENQVDSTLAPPTWDETTCPSGKISAPDWPCLACNEPERSGPWTRSLANADLHSEPRSERPADLAGAISWVRFEPELRSLGNTWGPHPARDGCPLLRQLYEPAHALIVSSTEVTQRQWSSVAGDNPAYFLDCPDCPVECVSSHEAMEFANRLSDASGLGRCYELTDCEGEFSPGSAGDACGAEYRCIVRRAAECSGYRLPNDREWEWIFTQSPEERYREFPRVTEGRGVTCPESSRERCRTLEVETHDGVVTGLSTNVAEMVDGVSSCGMLHQSGRTTVRGPGLWHAFFGIDQGRTRGTMTTGTRSPEIGFRLVRSMPAER